MPEYFTAEELADALQSLAIATADKKSAQILDAASVQMISLVETIDRLRAELKAIEESRQ